MKAMERIYNRIVDRAMNTPHGDADQVQMSEKERSLLYELMHTRVKLEFRTWISRVALTIAGGMGVWVYTHW